MSRRLPALLLALAALLIAGCGGGPAEPTVVPTPTPTPREIAAQIGRATQASQSAHFAVAFSGKPVQVVAGAITATLNSIEGDLKRPDGVLSILSVTLGGAVAELRTISLGGQQYLTNPITRQWQCLAPGSAFDPAVLFAEGSGIEHMLQEGFSEVSLVGTEDLGGVPSYHLRGVMPGEQLQPISMGLLSAGPVQVDLWADAATMRASQIVLVDTASDPATPSTWTMTFSDYDKTVDVRAPVQC